MSENLTVFDDVHHCDFAGAAINHPPAPPPRPLPPPTQPSADAKSGTGRLERRQAGRPAYLNVYVGCIERPRRDTIGKKLIKSWTRLFLCLYA